jgi:hypothetical protein
MPGYTDKSRRYLRLADEQMHRAEAALAPHARSTFLALARQYRELASRIDDPAHWRLHPNGARSATKGGTRRAD